MVVELYLAVHTSSGTEERGSISGDLCSGQVQNPTVRMDLSAHFRLLNLSHSQWLMDCVGTFFCLWEEKLCVHLQVIFLNLPGDTIVLVEPIPPEQSNFKFLFFLRQSHVTASRGAEANVEGFVF